MEVYLIGCIAVGVSMLVTVLAGGALLGFSAAFSGAVVTLRRRLHRRDAGDGPRKGDRGHRAGGAAAAAGHDHRRHRSADRLAWLQSRYISRLKKNGGVPASQSSQPQQEERLNRYHQPYSSPENPSPFFTAWVPPKYETEAVALFQLAVTVLLATWLGELTGLGWAFMLVVIGLAGKLSGLFQAQHAAAHRLLRHHHVLDLCNGL